MAALADIYYSILDENNADKRVQGWPLVSDNWKIVGVIATYLALVYVVLPLYMRNRKPYSLKKVIVAYNLIQIVSCSLLVYGIATSGWTTHYSLGCQPASFSSTPINMRMAKYMWWNLAIKMFELLETLMYVLKKKHSQVSALHVYHHAFTVYIAWFVGRFTPEGMVTFDVLVNSSVHIVMYTYYLLASLGPAMQEKLKYVKSKLTVLQIAQLVLLELHTLQGILPSCRLSKMERIAHYIYSPAILVMILLFLNFYVKAFLFKSKKQK